MRGRAAILLAAAAAGAAPRDTAPDTWMAVDGLGRELPMHAETGPPRAGATVGMFHFIWHAGWRTSAIHDISRILEGNPAQPAWGPVHAPHWWGEPRLGYYRPDDRWVIRRHLQMLGDAGVDALIVDVSNGLTYDRERDALCEEILALRAQGRRAPGIAFLAWSKAPATVGRLWREFYQPGRHAEAWFRWKGKPLLLAPPEAIPAEAAGFFSRRTSWAWSGQPWFGDGRDRWAWLDHHPQRAGWTDSPGRPEAMPVAVAQHPTSNIGRSFHRGRQPTGSGVRTAEGLCFDEQWRRALEVRPEFVLVTGWNEWVAQRFVAKPGENLRLLGRKLSPGDTYFVDLFNPEFSRDIEPMRGGHGDAYLWQLAGNVRRLKGARPPPPPASPTPGGVANNPGHGSWNSATAYLDDAGDADHRDHPGVPGAGQLVNRTGRNDLTEARVAHDGDRLGFLVRTQGTLTPPTGEDWMVLWIDTDADGRTGRLGYELRVNRRRETPGRCSVERWDGAVWKPAGEADLRVTAQALTLTLDQRMVWPTGPGALGFKWTDNVPADGEGMDFLDHGDSAPNARYRYRYEARR